jgi:hypothetical protein
MQLAAYLSPLFYKCLELPKNYHKSTIKIGTLYPRVGNGTIVLLGFFCPLYVSKKMTIEADLFQNSFYATFHRKADILNPKLVYKCLVEYRCRESIPNSIFPLLKLHKWFSERRRPCS